MHLAPASFRRWITLTALAVGSCTVAIANAGDRTPLVGTGPVPQSRASTSTLSGEIGLIVQIDPELVPCPQSATFSDVDGGATPGTYYDGILVSGGLMFAERFAGQLLTYSGDFDVISGTPTNPLLPQAGASGQNLDVFDYAGNVLAGLGPVGYPDIDAIGEGSISIYFPVAQSKVKLYLLGGNGGSATLSFYRADGSLIDDVVVSNLGDLQYGFATLDGSYSIRGILVQNSDASGIGVDDICYDAAPVSARPLTWGSLKQLYR